VGRLGAVAHLKSARALGEVIHVGVVLKGIREWRVRVHVIDELLGGVEHGVVPVHAVTHRGVLGVHGRAGAEQACVRTAEGARSAGVEAQC
jgi:hypothetical protein